MLPKINGVMRISQEIELRYLPDGKPVARINLVSSSKYKTQSGEQKENTCFIEGTCFGKSAEILNQYCSKGSKLYIIGELMQDTWTDNNGNNRSKHKILIESFEFLDSKQNNQKDTYQENKVQTQPKIIDERKTAKFPEIEDDSEQEYIPF
jgi:single-strand DNA-binding protein